MPRFWEKDRRDYGGSGILDVEGVSAIPLSSLPVCRSRTLRNRNDDLDNTYLPLALCADDIGNEFMTSLKVDRIFRPTMLRNLSRSLNHFV